MTSIHGIAKRFSLGLLSDDSRTRRASGTTRRARRGFCPTVDGLPPRIAPAVLILPAQDPDPTPPSPYTH